MAHLPYESHILIMNKILLATLILCSTGTSIIEAKNTKPVVLNTMNTNELLELFLCICEQLNELENQDSFMPSSKVYCDLKLNKDKIERILRYQIIGN